MGARVQVYLQTGPLGRHQTVNPVWGRWCWCPLQAGWPVLTERTQKTSLFKRLNETLQTCFGPELQQLTACFNAASFHNELIINFNKSHISSYSLTSAPPPLWLNCIISTDAALRPHPRSADWKHSIEEGKTALGRLCHPSGRTSCSQTVNLNRSSTDGGSRGSSLHRHPTDTGDEKWVQQGSQMQLRVGLKQHRLFVFH